MTLYSFGCVASLLLRAGCWPVHPLADPALIRFGEWLPVEWRRNKRLHRERLARLGFDREITHPKKPENFAYIMRAALQRNAPGIIRRMLHDGSPLIDLGIVNPDGLKMTLERIASGGYQERDSELYDTLSLELTMRALAS